MDQTSFSTRTKHSPLSGLFWGLIVFLFAFAANSTHRYISRTNASQGIQEYSQGQFAQAIPHLKRLIVLEPHNLGLRSYLAYSLYRQNQDAEAIVEYKKLIASGAAQYYDYFNCGNAQADLHERSEAKCSWEIAATQVNTAIKNEKSNMQAGSDIRLAYMAAIKDDIRQAQETP